MGLSIIGAVELSEWLSSEGRDGDLGRSVVLAVQRYLVAIVKTSSSTSQLLSISDSVKEGCTRNIMLVSPSSCAFASRPG